VQSKNSAKFSEEVRFYIEHIRFVWNCLISSKS